MIPVMQLLGAIATLQMHDREVLLPVQVLSWRTQKYDPGDAAVGSDSDLTDARPGSPPARANAKLEDAEIDLLINCKSLLQKMQKKTCYRRG